MRRSKIHCMVVHAYYPLGETRVEREARALVEQGYLVDVLCLRNAGESAIETRDGITVYRLPVKRHKMRGLFIQLLEYLTFWILVFFKLIVLHFRKSYPVIQVHNLPDFLVFSALIPKLAGARIIIDLHDLMPEFYAARFNTSMDSWPVRLVQWQEKISCSFADHVITVTKLWRETLIQRGIEAEKISVVMNVADASIFKRSVGAGAKIMQTKRFHLIYHGNLTQRYGLDLAIKAVAEVREKIPQIYLTIHGQGPYLEPLIQLAHELEVDDCVEFSTHFMPTSELPILIKRADVGVVPYRSDVFTDSILPTKLMEYVALGIPVIAARTSAIEAYFDETMVQFFAPEAIEDLVRCIVLLYSNEKRRQQLIEASESFNQQYNWIKLSAKYVAQVEKLGIARV